MEYTFAALKAGLQVYAEDDDTEFVNELPNLVRKGELRLMRELDLDNLDTVTNTSTVVDSPLVTKPPGLVNERLVVFDDGIKRALRKRSRAWIEAINAFGDTGPPEYYAEYSDTQWFLGPIPNTANNIVVHGQYAPNSLADAGENGTTWLSTRMGDLLFLACAIEAYEFLKMWGHKAGAESDLDDKVVKALGIIANLTRSDIEDMMGPRVLQNAPPTQAQG